MERSSKHHEMEKPSKSTNWGWVIFIAILVILGIIAFSHHRQSLQANYNSGTAMSANGSSTPGMIGTGTYSGSGTVTGTATITNVGTPGASSTPSGQ